MRPLVLVLALVAAACDKKEPPAPAPAASAKEGALAEQGRAALVAQQCSIACTARPGIDPGACTTACNKACAGSKDIDTVDACTSKVAAAQPAVQ